MIRAPAGTHTTAVVTTRVPKHVGKSAPSGAEAAPSHEDDAALIADVVAGRPERAGAFCQRVWRTVDRTVRRLLGHDDSEYDDLVQLAIVELIRSVRSFRGDGSLDGWVSAVTAHVVYRFIRRRSINRYIPIESVQPDALHSADPTGEDSVAQRESLARIVGHLDEIGEKMAWTFVLHDVLGYRLRDVARIMGGSEAAAQSRLVRGRRRLHELIASDPILLELRRATPPGPADGGDRDGE
jgi:RNA polymerase sigma-70 factor, ECF subfamily